MKNKSQIELLIPVNEDISGMHRPNKDVNNLEDSECEPRKSFTDDDSLDDNLKKEALGLFDLPAGAPDGAQNFRSRDSYKEEDFEASNKTGFGGESVINIDEDQHPINIQRRDEFNSANNDENRKKDFFSFLGFKSTGRSMNKELEKLASVLSKSGYPEVSEQIIKTAIPHLVIPLSFWLYSGGAATAAAGGAFWDWNSNNSDLLKRIGADQESSVQEIYEKYKTYLRNYDLVYGLGEWPKGNHADGLKLVEKLQKKFDKGQKITESEFEKMCDDITEDDINFFDDEAFFVNAHNEIVKLKGMAMEADKKRSKDPDAKLEHQYTMGDEYINKEKKKREEKLSKEEKKKRDKQKADALANAQIVETWYDSISNQVLGRDEFGRIQVQDPADFSFSFIDGYPGANWKKSFDKDSRLWRASKRYRVIQYEDPAGSGKFTNFPFQGSGSKSASIGVNKKMIKMSISKRDKIIKNAKQGVSKSELTELNKRKRTKLDQINTPDVLRAINKGKQAVEDLWNNKYLPLMRADRAKYQSNMQGFFAAVKYDPGAFKSHAFLSSTVKNYLITDWRWENVGSGARFTRKRMKKAVRDALDANNVTRASDSYPNPFDIKGSNFTYLDSMQEALDNWTNNREAYADSYWALKIMGPGQTVPGGGGIGSGKTGTPKGPVGGVAGLTRVSVGKDAAAGIMRYKDQAGPPTYDKPFYWVCTVKGANNLNACKFAPLGAGEFGRKRRPGWGTNNNKPVLIINEASGPKMWVNNSWQPFTAPKKSSLTIREKRLIKSGMKKQSIRENRLSKLATVVMPTDYGGPSDENKDQKNTNPGVGGGGCPVGVRPEVKGLKSKFCAPNEALPTQRLLKKYKDLGRVDGNWGSCSHSAWLYFIDDIESQGKKNKDYANRIEGYTTALRSKKVTLAVVKEAIGAYEALGGTTPGAAASTVNNFADIKKQVDEEKEGKIFTKDLLLKYLLGDYDKSLLLTSGKVFNLIKRHGERLLKTPKRRGKEKPKPSKISKYPEQIRNEFKELYGTTTENAEITSITWDWRFLQYKAGRGPYILTKIISDPEARKEVIKSLKKDVCGIDEGDETSTCNKDFIDDLRAQELRRTEIDIDAERSRLAKEDQDKASKDNAKAQANLKKLSKQLFSMRNPLTEVMIKLQQAGFKYISTNGALITQDSDMADMVRDNEKAGKLEALLPKVIPVAADFFEKRLYADVDLLNKIYEELSKKYVSGKGQTESAFRTNRTSNIEKIIADAHRGIKEWRAGYIMEAILASGKKDLLEETDASWWDLGIGRDSRKDILDKYRQQASDSRNKITKDQYERLMAGGGG